MRRPRAWRRSDERDRNSDVLPCRGAHGEGAGYLIQLCKHFGYKLPATYAHNRGRIAFKMGIAELDATNPDVLRITVSTDDPSQIPVLEDVVERYLRRFAFKEKLVMAWAGG